MKVSQREKVMLIFMCIALVGVLLYMAIIKPKTAEITQLGEELLTAQGDWTTKSDPIITAFAFSEDNAKSIWTLEGQALQTELDRLLYNRYYDLGNRITDLKGVAYELSNSSILPAQPEFQLYAKIKEEHFDPFIDYSLYSISERQITEYSMPSEGEAEAEAEAEGVSYSIATARINVQSFNCYNTEDFFEMINLMEKCGYILIESVRYDPASRVGDITILILMTPGDLGEYNVIMSPYTTRYIEADSVVCKYTGSVINQGSEEE